MKRLSATEIGALILAALFVAGGVRSVVAPREGLIGHQSYKHSIPSSFEYVSKDAARVYGAIAILFGVGLGGIVFYRRR